MTEPRDLRALRLSVVARVLEDSGEPVGVIVLDAAGAGIDPINAYLRDVFGNGASRSTCRSYAYALVRWWRFLNAVAVPWTQAGPTEHIDFVVWMRSSQPHRGGSASGSEAQTGQAYAARTINHSNAVIAGFYDYHARRGSGPMLSPVRALAVRAHAHHNPMHTFSSPLRRAGQQRVPVAAPQAIPDEVFNQLFAQLRSNRDRALVAFYVSSGARAAELLGVTGDGIDAGRNRVRVHRKGDRREQWIPASPDSFLWLSLYLGSRPLRNGEPVWQTLRQPQRPLNYHALRRVFQRAQETLGTRYTIHQLRHTAAYRMVQDPNLSLTDVAWVLGHASVTTTQIYTVPLLDDLLTKMTVHFARPPAPAPVAAPNYDADALDVLFGGRHV